MDRSCISHARELNIPSNDLIRRIGIHHPPEEESKNAKSPTRFMPLVAKKRIGLILKPKSREGTEGNLPYGIKELVLFESALEEGLADHTIK